MALKLVELSPVKPVESVVKLLEDLLAQAKAGDVRAISLVADCKDYVRTESTGERDVFATLGQLDRLKYVLHKMVDAEETTK